MHKHLKFTAYYVYTISQVLYIISATIIHLNHYHPLTQNTTRVIKISNGFCHEHKLSSHFFFKLGVKAKKPQSVTVEINNLIYTYKENKHLRILM